MPKSSIKPVGQYVDQRTSVKIPESPRKNRADNRNLKKVEEENDLKTRELKKAESKLARTQKRLNSLKSETVSISERALGSRKFWSAVSMAIATGALVITKPELMLDVFGWERAAQVAEYVGYDAVQNGLNAGVVVVSSSAASGLTWCVNKLFDPSKVVDEEKLEAKKV